MKNISILLLLIGTTLSFSIVNAQINKSRSINEQPPWGPQGYENAEYYYLPDLESYYNIATNQFIYLKDGKWKFTAHLPNSCKYNLFDGYKVVLNTQNAYEQFNIHRLKYAKYKNIKGQATNKKACDVKRSGSKISQIKKTLK